MKGDKKQKLTQRKVCAICGAREGIEFGCSACIGISHFPEVPKKKDEGDKP